MKRRGQWGQVVNISSMSGHRVANGGTGGAFYSATKHAVKALTEGLRQEVRKQCQPGPLVGATYCHLGPAKMAVDWGSEALAEALCYPPKSAASMPTAVQTKVWSAITPC